MVKVYKTNIRKIKDAERVLSILSRHYPGSGINFDLEDSDKILRIESSTEEVHSKSVEDIIENAGYWIEELEDTIPAYH